MAKAKPCMQMHVSQGGKKRWHLHTHIHVGLKHAREQPNVHIWLYTQACAYVHWLHGAIYPCIKSEGELSSQEAYWLVAWSIRIHGMFTLLSFLTLLNWTLSQFPVSL